MPAGRWFVPAMAVVGVLACSGGEGTSAAPLPEALARVDHLVFAAPDLDSGIARIEELLGVRAVFSGAHPGRGTRNALLALGPTTYLEVIAPDPEQPDPMGPRSFGLDTLTAPRLAGWAARDPDLEDLVNRATRAGVRLAPVSPGSRIRPDGVRLAWTTTGFDLPVAEDVLPFFIAWSPDSPHPATTAPPCCRLVALRIEHPDPLRIRGLLEPLGFTIEVGAGPAPALIATIETDRGLIELR